MVGVLLQYLACLKAVRNRERRGSSRETEVEKKTGRTQRLARRQALYAFFCFFWTSEGKQLLVVKGAGVYVSSERCFGRRCDAARI